MLYAPGRKFSSFVIQCGDMAVGPRNVCSTNRVLKTIFLRRSLINKSRPVPTPNRRRTVDGFQSPPPLSLVLITSRGRMLFIRSSFNLDSIRFVALLGCSTCDIPGISKFSTCGSWRNYLPKQSGHSCKTREGTVKGRVEHSRWVGGCG